MFCASQSMCAAVGGSVCSRGPSVTLVQCCVPSHTPENLTKFMAWWHSCWECSPLPCALFLVFPAALKGTGFSGFLRSGMHTLCHGKEPVRVQQGQMLLKRNPRLSGAVVAWSHPPVLLPHSQQLALLSWSVVLIHLELAFSLVERQSISNSFAISGIL